MAPTTKPAAEAAHRERKPRGQGHERRAEILAAAKTLFVAHGFESVTTRMLAERAGISQTGLYVYFKNKEEILDALCHVTFDGLVQRICALSDTMPPGPELLRAIMRGYIDFGLAHPDEYQITFTVKLDLKPKVADYSLPPHEQPPGLGAFVLFREQIEKLMSAGTIAAGDPTVTTQVLWSAMHGLVSLLIARPSFPWADREVLIDTLLDTLMAGLAADGAGARAAGR